MEQPTQFPRWADDPPVAPPTTVTEPSEPEKAEGFQPGTQAQVIDFVIDVVANSATYTARINGNNASFTSDGSATLAEILDAMQDEIDLLGEDVTTSQTGIAVRVTANTPGVAFAYDTTVPNRVTPTLVTPNRSNKPIRQYLNWLFFKIYTWVAWLYQSVFRADVFGPDQALPLGTVPSIGSGLDIYAGDFSGSVWANGYSVSLVESPEHTYNDETDTYWDLGADGEWYPVEAATGDPEPAVTSNATRVYMVTTTGGDRTAITDYRVARLTLNALDVQQIRLGDARRGSAAERAEARLIVRFADGASTGYTEILEAEEDGVSTNRDVRLYIRHETKQLCLVSGARWDGAQWVATAGFAKRQDLGYPIETRILPSTPGTFPDSTWDAIPVTTTAIRESAFNGTVAGGGEMMADAVNRLMVPAFREEDVGANARGLGLVAGPWREYAMGSGTGNTDDSAQYGREFVSNAYLDEATGLWTRIQAGTHSMLVQVSATWGFRVFRRSSALADTWDDTQVPSTGWAPVVAFGAAGGVISGGLVVAGETSFSDNVNVAGDLGVDGDASVDGNLTVDGDLTTGGSLGVGTLSLDDGLNTDSPLPHVLYERAFQKAGGRIVVNGGTITIGAAGFGYTATINSGNLRITLLNPVSAGLSLGVSLGGTGGVAYIVRHSVVSANTIDFSFYEFDATPYSLAAGTAELCFDATYRT